MKQLIFTRTPPNKISEDIIYVITEGVITQKYRGSKNIYHITEFNEQYKNPNYINKYLFFLQKKSIDHFMKNFSYKGTSLWYLFEYILFYETNELKSMPSIARIMYDIDCVTNCITKLKPDIVECSFFDPKYNLIKEVSEKKNIPCRKSYSFCIKRFNVNKYLFKPALFCKMILKLLSKKSSIKHTDNVFICSDRYYSNGIDSLYEGIQNDLSSNYKTIVYDRAWVLNKNIFVKIYSLYKDPGHEYVGQYYGSKEFFNTFKINHSIKKMYNANLLSELSTKLVYKDINLFPYLKSRLSFVFNHFSVFIADILSTTESIMAKNDSGTFYIEHEENYYGKSLIYNKKKQVIKALQTELVYPNGCLHRYVHDDRVLDKGTDLWRPLPDIKFVSGEYPYNVLVRYGNYPKSILEINGMAKYSDLQEKSFNIKNLMGKYGFSKDYKNILYASGGVKEDEEKLRELIKFVSNNDDVKLYIKAHPSCDVKLLRKICSGSNNSNVIILFEGSIPELISICNLMISVHSTVIMDAFILNKPVMLINELEENMPYSEFTDIITVKDLSKLSSTLNFCLSREYGEVVKSYSRFIESYMGIFNK